LSSFYHVVDHCDLTVLTKCAVQQIQTVWTFICLIYTFKALQLQKNSSLSSHIFTSYFLDWVAEITSLFLQRYWQKLLMISTFEYIMLIILNVCDHVNLIVIIMLMVAESVSLINSWKPLVYKVSKHVSTLLTDIADKSTLTIFYIQLRILVQINWLMSTFCKTLNRISLQIILWWCFYLILQNMRVTVYALDTFKLTEWEISCHMSLQLDQHCKVLWANVTKALQV
jgi:hypothetical protein